MADHAANAAGNSMSFGEAIWSGLRNYATGFWRASRSEFWFFLLFTFLVTSVAAILDVGLGTSKINDAGVLEMLSDLAFLVPSFAVGIRRLHDIGRNGWWLLFGMIPIVGWALLLVSTCMKGTSGPNRYGPDPFESEVLAVI